MCITGADYAGVVLQVIGGVLTFYGLLTTWLRYNDRRTPRIWLRDLWRRLTGWKGTVTVQVGTAWAVSESAGSADAAVVTVENATLETRVDRLESRVDQIIENTEKLGREIRQEFKEALKEHGQAQANALAELAQRLPKVQKEVALDGIGIAIWGLAITVVGTVVGALAFGC